MDALREAVINSFVHARYDMPVQHETDGFSNRIAIIIPGSFANEFEPKDFAEREIHSLLRNEKTARVLYLCKNVETFGSGIRKIYNLCTASGVLVSYQNTDTDFTIEFSGKDRNASADWEKEAAVPHSPIGKAEETVISLLRRNPYMTNKELAEVTRKSLSTIFRALAAQKEKGLISRVGSNKKGFWHTFGWIGMCFRMMDFVRQNPMLVKCVDRICGE